MTDLFSRYTETAILNNITSKSVVKAFDKKWISIHGAPLSCLTDNGRQFISEEFGNLLKLNDINHVKSSPNNPTGNSIVERVNKDIGNVLRISINQSMNSLIKNIWKRINLNANITTNHAPYEVFFNAPKFKNVSMKIPINYKQIIDKLNHKIKTFNEFMKKKKKVHEYKQGDMIYLKKFCSDKVCPKWLGPFKVINTSKSKNNVHIDKGNKTTRTSIKHVRPYKGGEDVASDASATNLIENKNQRENLDNKFEDDEIDKIDENGEMINSGVISDVIDQIGENLDEKKEGKLSKKNQ
ncbi:Pol polyprotein [Dictyocoela muelleri]|nr:Pol polyprotein [Dictyocoela muelleri]